MINESAQNAWMNRATKAGAVKFNGTEEHGNSLQRHITAHDHTGKIISKFDRVTNKEVPVAKLEEGKIGKLIKNIKRGLDGWDRDAIDIHGKKMDPKSVVNKTKARSDSELKSLSDTFADKSKNPIFRTADYDGKDKHSPAGLQKRVVDREMKKRGLSEEHQVGDHVWVKTDKKWKTLAGRISRVGRTTVDVEHKDGTKSTVPHSQASQEFPYENPYRKDESVMTFIQWNRLDEANASKSDVNGKIHEVLVGHYLNGGNFINDDHKKTHDSLKNQMTSEQYADEVKKAKVGAEGIKAAVAKKGGIKRVGWTSKPGGIKEFTNGKHDVSQHDDASDLMLEHPDGSFTGVSLKSTQSHSAKAGVSNEGRKSVDKRLGTNTDHHIANAKQEVVNKRSELSGMTDTQAKAHIKQNADLKSVVDAAGAKALHNIRNDWHAAYQNMDSKTHADHIRKLLHAGPTEIPHLKSTTSGTNGNHRNTIINPEEHYAPFLKDHKNLHTEAAGNAGINHYHLDPKTGKKTILVHERAKFSSQALASPVKTSNA